MSPIVLITIRWAKYARVGNRPNYSECHSQNIRQLAVGILDLKCMNSRAGRGALDLVRRGHNIHTRSNPIDQNLGSRLKVIP